MTCLMFQRRLSNITTKERLELATTLSVLPWDSLYGFCICIDSAFMGRSTPTTAFDEAI